MQTYDTGCLVHIDFATTARMTVAPVSHYITSIFSLTVSVVHYSYSVLGDGYHVLMLASLQPLMQANNRARSVCAAVGQSRD